MNVPVRSRSGLAAVLALVSAFAAVALRAQSVPNGGRFELSGDFFVLVDGEASPKATLYLSQPARAWVLIAPELPSPVLVAVATRQVEILDLMRVGRQEGFVDLLPQATLAVEGAWQMSGEDITFRVGARSVRLKPRPWMLGSHTGAELLDHDPSYGRKAQLYRPIAEVVDRIRGAKADVRVLAFFGSWCPHCKDYLPSLLKVEQELKGAKLRFDYYGVPSPFTNEPEATKWQVKGVPTAIVLVAGKEVGRIGGTQWASPESTIYDLLKGAGAL